MAERRDEVTGRDLAELVRWARRVEGQADELKGRWSGTVYAGDVVTVRGLLGEVGRAVGDLVAWCEGQQGMPVVAGHCWLCDVTYGAEGHTCPQRTVQGLEGGSRDVSRQSTITWARPEVATVSVARGSEPGLGLQLPGEAERGGSTCVLCGGSGVVEYREVEYGGVEGGRGETAWTSTTCDCQVPPLDTEDL